MKKFLYTTGKPLAVVANFFLLLVFAVVQVLMYDDGRSLIKSDFIMFYSVLFFVFCVSLVLLAILYKTKNGSWLLLFGSGLECCLIAVYIHNNSFAGEVIAILLFLIIFFSHLTINIRRVLTWWNK